MTIPSPTRVRDEKRADATTPRCQHCGHALDGSETWGYYGAHKRRAPATTGRKPKYCSDACKMLAYRDRKGQAARDARYAAHNYAAGTFLTCPNCNAQLLVPEETLGPIRCPIPLCGSQMQRDEQLQLFT